jgi:hypothetical protein
MNVSHKKRLPIEDEIKRQLDELDYSDPQTASLLTGMAEELVKHSRRYRDLVNEQHCKLRVAARKAIRKQVEFDRSVEAA